VGGRAPASPASDLTWSVTRYVIEKILSPRQTFFPPGRVTVADLALAVHRATRIERGRDVVVRWLLRVGSMMPASRRSPVFRFLGIDRSRVSVAGLVLVRQRPGSANGVLFITLEDETEIANLIVWPSLFERQRRLILSASMIGCRGKVQREGEVIHVIAEHLTDLSGLLGAVGERDQAFPLPHGRGDEAKHGSGPDPRGALGRKPRDIYIPDLRIEGAINLRTRDFR
jgi:hypothetical protein